MLTVEKIKSGYYVRKLPLLEDLIGQTLNPPEVAVLGSVHRENVGDMALSASVGSVLAEKKLSWGMQPTGSKGIFGLSQWPKGEGRAIIAGET